MPSALDNDIRVQTSGVTAIHPAGASWAEAGTRDLMTRPCMVLETDDGADGTVQLVLYGGSITRSIGDVAYRNEYIFQPGTDSYEFIWSILEYAYPGLYEQEYQRK